jgi:hypothetical protein
VRLAFPILAVLASLAVAAELKPDPGARRPRDGETPVFNPPSLLWPHESGAHTYTVQWTSQARPGVAVTVGNLPFNTYTHHAPLPPGECQWRYRHADKAGKDSAWSPWRAFTVAPSAIEFPMPTRAQQRERLPGGHPRLFMRPEDVPRLRELARGGLAARFAELRGQAEKLLKRQPVPEPAARGSARNKEDVEAIKHWWPNRERAEQACDEACTVAFVYLLSGEKKFGEAARRRILNLASWDPDGPTNFALNCEAGKVMLYRWMRAYDWAYDALTAEDRARVARGMLRRATDAWNSGEIGRGVGHLSRPFSSHGNRVWHKLAETAIALYGDVPEAETWLDYAVNKFFACYPVWSDDDGGWHEGASYEAGYMGKVVGWLLVAQAALGIDGFKKPFFAQVGDFPLYVAPPGSPNMGFGDLSNNRPSSGWGGFMDFFQRAMARRPGGSRAGYWRWWSEQWNMKPPGGVLGFLYEAGLPAPPKATPPDDLPPSKVFHGIGVASLHVTLKDSADDVHLLFKSSPFGRQSHGHNPQNSFQLNAYGDALLTTCVYRDLHGSKFHSRWCHETKAHNAVLVDGEGQIKHSAASTGRIVGEQLGPQFDYLAGDATAAYGGRLVRYHRHVLFVKPDLIVLYDDLAARTPASFQFMLHALGAFSVDEKSASLAVRQPRAGCAVKYLSPVPLAFRQWDGYDPKPTKNFPNQWHVEAGTREKREQLGMITLLLPHRTGAKPQFAAERLESGTAIGARIRRGGRSQVVAFRKDAAEGAATLGGFTFEGPAAVR